MNKVTFETELNDEDALNLHSVFQKGTVEFRMFNSTLHAGKVNVHTVQPCHRQSGADAAQCPCGADATNDRYTFRTWLLRLGMIGGV